MQWHFEVVTSALTTLLDRGRSYGVSHIQELSHFVIHLEGYGLRIGTKHISDTKIDVV